MKPVTLIKKLLTASAVIVLLALDWAALHDITKGESDTTLEYTVVLFSLVAFGLLFLFWNKNRKHSAQALK